VGHKWTADDLLPINGTPEEEDRLWEELQKRRAAVKAGKKEKKAAANGKVVDISASAADGAEGNKRPPAGESGAPQAKKFKAVDSLHSKHASKELYASLFTSSSKGGGKETYGCRSLSSRGFT
jgi:type IV secretory pathway VirB10-like protein